MHSELFRRVGHASPYLISNNAVTRKHLLVLSLLCRQAGFSESGLAPIYRKFEPSPFIVLNLGAFSRKNLFFIRYLFIRVFLKKSLVSVESTDTLLVTSPLAPLLSCSSCALAVLAFPRAKRYQHQTDQYINTFLKT